MWFEAYERIGDGLTVAAHDGVFLADLGEKAMCLGCEVLAFCEAESNVQARSQDKGS